MNKYEARNGTLALEVSKQEKCIEVKKTLLLMTWRKPLWVWGLFWGVHLDREALGGLSR